MHKSLVVLFLCTLSLLSPVAMAQDGGHQPDLSPEMRAAFDALAKRDPSARAEMERMLQSDPGAARHHLEEFARYFRERGEAEKSDPGKFALLEKHEKSEADVKRLVRQLNLTKAEEERRPLIDQLRHELDGWFDVRQSLKEHEVSRFAAKLEEERKHQHERGAQREMPRTEWLGRIIEGGAPAMQERIKFLSNDDVLPAIAPLLVRMILREDPQQGEALVALSQADKTKFEERLRALISARPELAEQAKRQAADEVRVQLNLHTALREAHQLLLPRVTKERQADLASDAAVQKALDRVIDAELAIADANLHQAESELAAKRAMLANRAAHKAAIVDNQLARLTGREDEVEW